MAQVAATVYQDKGVIDYTPGSAVTGGDVVVLGGIVGIAKHDIAANVKGSLATEGLFKVPKTTAAWTVGLPVHWNPTGDPDSGTAGTGAANQLGIGTFMGMAVIAAASGDDYGIVALNEVAGGYGAMPRIPTQTVAAAGTVAADAGVLIEGFNLVSGADDTKGVVLPAAVKGRQVIVKVGDGADLKVWPATGDGINAIAVNSAMVLVDDVCCTFIALDATTWYTTPLLPS